MIKTQSVENSIKYEIQKHSPGWCFTPISFSNLGSDESVRKALSDLAKQGFIRRLTQGIYEYPRLHQVLGVVPPDLYIVAKVIAEKNGVDIQPTGEHAANLLGLSEQVPARLVFLTEGPSRKVKIGNHELVFKKSTKKVMSTAGTKEGLVIQAIKHIGKENINEAIKTKIKKIFTPIESKKKIKENFKYAPAWVRSIIYEILELKR
jgi:hypothetical protein